MSSEKREKRYNNGPATFASEVLNAYKREFSYSPLEFLRTMHHELSAKRFEIFLEEHKKEENEQWPACEVDKLSANRVAVDKKIRIW